MNVDVMLERVEAAMDKQRRQLFANTFPDCTLRCRPTSMNPAHHLSLDGSRRFCRALYVKHLAFFRAGADYRERLFLKANRVGGTRAAAYEVVCHATGVYPHWWEGRRFSTAGSWWVCGRTGQTTRDICQLELLGPPEAYGTGMLPSHLIAHKSPKSGLANAIDTIWVRHHAGKIATLQFKSFDQGRTAFEGTAKQGIWADEEVPDDIADECAMRTLTTGGLLLYTFTPLQGLTEFVETFIDQADMDDGHGGIVPAKDSFWPSVKGEVEYADESETRAQKRASPGATTAETAVAAARTRGAARGADRGRGRRRAAEESAAE